MKNLILILFVLTLSPLAFAEEKSCLETITTAEDLKDPEVQAEIATWFARSYITRPGGTPPSSQEEYSSIFNAIKDKASYTVVTIIKDLSQGFPVVTGLVVEASVTYKDAYIHGTFKATRHAKTEDHRLIFEWGSEAMDLNIEVEEDPVNILLGEVKEIVGKDSKEIRAEAEIIDYAMPDLKDDSVLQSISEEFINHLKEFGEKAPGELQVYTGAEIREGLSTFANPPLGYLKPAQFKLFELYNMEAIHGVVWADQGDVHVGSMEVYVYTTNNKRLKVTVVWERPRAY